jgi:hypothetical protein
MTMHRDTPMLTTTTRGHDLERRQHVKLFFAQTCNNALLSIPLNTAIQRVDALRVCLHCIGLDEASRTWPSGQLLRA